MHKLLPLLVISTLVLLILVFGGSVKSELKKKELSGSPAINELSSQSFINRILLSDGQIEKEATSGIWFNQKVSFPESKLLSLLSTEPSKVLGESSGEKWIEINLSEQKLYAHEGNRTVYTFPISSGLPWMPTITGEFRIWAKIRSQRMTGGSKTDGTFYDLPNVPYVQYFYKGYGIHGAYWHNDFGRPRSHGCVNMRPEDAKTLYYWTNPTLAEGKNYLVNIPPQESTRVVVSGSTPTSIN